MEAIAGMVLDFGFKMFKSRSDFNENLETLERNVKLLSDRAFDVKTDVENRERSGKKKRKRQVGSWLDEVTKVEEGLHALKEEVARGKKNVGALEKMNGRVGELLEQSKYFGTLVHDMYEREECLLQAPQVHAEKSKQNLEVIWTWLHDENVSSIGIYGMGGVGKTTLAKHIHNRLVNEVAYHVRWVTVSQGFSIKGLQDDLAKIVNLDLSDEVDELRRAAKLNKAFKETENIVIILDDVWDGLSLEKLGVPLGVEGCRLILTTRLRYVCQKMGCQKRLEVKKLNTNDAWELFRKNLGDDTVLSPDIEPVAQSMAGRCKGLPLGLITLAGSMRGVTDIAEWRNALEEFTDDMESDVFKVLQYSYDRLRDKNVQECFLYCALYPEDFLIDRDELIGRFIMEGLVKRDSRQKEFDRGHTILNKLEKVCLLEAADEKRVKMHDLLREMALRINPRYMVRAGIGSQVPEELDWTSDLDKVSFLRSEIKGIPEGMAPNCPTLSTLLLHRCRLRRIPESFFQHMDNLQVLDLSYNSALTDLPSCISNLGSLRTLSLGGCYGLRYVPPLGKLKNLRVLDLHRTGIKEVPQGMGNLVKLKFLDMGRIALKELPKEILPKLSHLQYLKIPECINARGEDLASLELLEEFEGRFCDLHNFNKFMTSRSNYDKDWWYRICVRPNSVLPGLPFFIPNHTIKERSVVVRYFTIEAGGGEAPTSIILPHCIDIVDISNCNGLSSCLVDNFLSRTTLRGLICQISECDDIEWIVNVPSGRNTTTDPHCICFHSLTLIHLPNIVGVCKGNIASHTFSALTELIINDCQKMKKLFPRAISQDLKNLERLRVRYCFEMEEIIGEEATDQDGSSQLGTSSDILILPKLKHLHLYIVPKLKSICEGKLICDSLEGMSFYKCPKLKRMPFYAPTTNALPFPALRTIKVVEKDWWETLEWEQSHLKTLFQPHIKYLPF